MFPTAATTSPSVGKTSTMSTSTVVLQSSSSSSTEFNSFTTVKQSSSSSLLVLDNNNNNNRRATTSHLDDNDHLLLKESSSSTLQQQFNFPSPSLLLLNQSSVANNNLVLSSPRRSVPQHNRLSLVSPISPSMIFNSTFEQPHEEYSSSSSSPSHHQHSELVANTNASPSKSRWSKLKSAFRRESKTTQSQPSADRLKSFHQQQQQLGGGEQQSLNYQYSNNNVDMSNGVGSHSFATLPTTTGGSGHTFHHNQHYSLQSSKSSPSLYSSSAADSNFRESSLSENNATGQVFVSPHHVPSGSSSNSSMTNSVNSVTSYGQFLQSSSSNNSIVSPTSNSTLSSIGVLENPMITMIMNGGDTKFSPPLSNMMVDGRGTSPPSPFSENLMIQTSKKVASPLSIQSGNEMISTSKSGLTENYTRSSPYTPPTPNENSDGTELPILQTTRKTKGNIKRLISMLTPRRKKSTSSKADPPKLNQMINSPINDGSSDPALLDVAHKRKLFEKRSSTESKAIQERTPKTPRADDEQIQRLVNEKIVTSKIQQFQTEESIGLALSQRKYSVSGKLANWLKSGGSEARFSRSFTDEKKEKRKSVFDFGKRDFESTPTIETPPTLQPILSNSTNEKLKRLIQKHHSANTPYTNPLSTLVESPKVEKEEPIPPILSSTTPMPRNLLVPILNFENETFKRTTEEIINGNQSSLLSNDSAYSIESSEDTSSSLQIITSELLNHTGSVENMRATVSSPTGALSPSALEYNTTIAPEYEVGDHDDEESIVTTIEYVPFTNYQEVKPKQLYSFVLEQFINNLSLDDQKCAECFESFLTGYLEFCKQSEKSNNESLREFANFSETDISRMRDFEKPKCFLLHQSAKRNRSSLIFLLITKYGCYVDAEDELESTPLHWATSHRAIDSILVLCQLGGKINIRDKYGKAPIHLLFAKAFYDEEHHEMESAIKCFKAAQMMCNMFEGDYNFKTSEGSTILHVACDQGRMEAVKFLVSESNDINTSDSVGTAFASSTQSGNKVLLNSKDKFGKTPLMRAATKGHTSIVEHIITNSKPNVVFGPMSRDERKQNVLHQAALQGLDALVNRIAFLNPSSCATMMQEQDASGNSPLHLAVSKGNIKTVNLFLTLLTKEVVNVVNEKGETPLHLACRVKDKPAAEKICRYLLQNGANADVKDNKHQTPRMLAAENELQISFGKKRR